MVKGKQRSSACNFLLRGVEMCLDWKSFIELLLPEHLITQKMLEGQWETLVQRCFAIHASVHQGVQEESSFTGPVLVLIDVSSSTGATMPKEARLMRFDTLKNTVSCGLFSEQSFFDAHPVF